MERDLAEAFSNRTVLVVGDVMLDQFVYGAVDRISQEAPIPVMKTQAETTSLGGAGNVARNVAALNGRAVLVGAVGHDAAGTQIAENLCPKAGIDVRLVRTPSYSTCVKTRFICEGRHMLRVDSETTALDDDALSRLQSTVDDALSSVDMLILSDYAKGVLTPESVRAHIEAAHAVGVRVLVDPKSGDLNVYRGADVITPNAAEASRATGHDCSTDVGAGRAAAAILKMNSVGTVLVTRGAQGMTLLAPQLGVEKPLHIPARASSAGDVSGAGDTVIATLALAIAAGIDLKDAAQLANAAAAITVGKPGTTTVSCQELLREVVGPKAPFSAAREHVAAQVRQWQEGGLTVGFANGCFDLVHPGHVALLQKAREQCDRLVVALNTDASVKRLKGVGRPIQDLASRAAVIGSLRSVDLVAMFDEDTPLELIKLLRPDLLIKGNDYQIHEVVGGDIIQEWGGRVSLIPIEDGHSTSKMISRLERASIV